MKLAVLKKALLITGLTLPLAGLAGSTQNDSQNMTGDRATAIYVQQNEARRAKIEATLAPIKSQMELQAYLATSKLGLSPLDALSLAAKQRFLASLRFNENGLTTFEYVDLENELTPTQIYRILSLFGAQRDTSLMKSARIQTDTDRLIMSPNVIGSPNGIVYYPPSEDHMDYECQGQHTCHRSAGDICMTGC